MSVSNKDLANAINESFQSVNEMDRNHETANVVDGLFAISRAIYAVADVLKKTKMVEKSGPPPPVIEFIRKENDDVKDRSTV